MCDNIFLLELWLETVQGEKKEPCHGNSCWDYGACCTEICQGVSEKLGISRREIPKSEKLVSHKCKSSYRSHTISQSYKRGSERFGDEFQIRFHGCSQIKHHLPGNILTFSGGQRRQWALSIRHIEKRREKKKRKKASKEKETQNPKGLINHPGGGSIAWSPAPVLSVTKNGFP